MQPFPRNYDAISLAEQENVLISLPAKLFGCSYPPFSKPESEQVVFQYSFLVQLPNSQDCL